MRLHSWHQRPLGKAVALVIGLAVAAVLAILAGGTGSGAVASTHPKIEATIFSYDGSDFVRTQTTLMDEKGKPATNTKLEHDSPAYKALADKRSYTGEAKVFGKK